MLRRDPTGPLRHRHGTIIKSNHRKEWQKDGGKNILFPIFLPLFFAFATIGQPAPFTVARFLHFRGLEITGMLGNDTSGLFALS